MGWLGCASQLVDSKGITGFSSNLNFQKALYQEWGHKNAFTFALTLKLIFSEKATKVCQISTVDLTGTTQDKYTVEILQNFVAFSEYMNFMLISDSVGGVRNHKKLTKSPEQCVNSVGNLDYLKIYEMHY